MGEYKNRKLIAFVCLSVLIVLLSAIWIRTLTRQVLVKALGMHNAFTEVVLFDQLKMQQAGIGDGINTETAEKKIDINWAKFYPFGDENGADISNASKEYGVINRYTEIVGSIKNNTDYYTSKFLPGYDYWLQAYRIYRDKINWNMEAAKKSNDVVVIRMENDYLTYQEPYVSNESITEIADSVEDFRDYLSTKNIPFYYVNFGSKVNPYDKQLSLADISRENTNENGDRLISALNERNVNTVDMRKLMREDRLDWYDSYYITDHHWTNKTGMWAAGKIAEILNQNEGYNFDNKYFDINNYTVTEYKDFWYGGQGQALNRIGCNKEPYSTIIPKFETNFEVNIPTDDFHEKGGYENVLFNMEHFTEITSPNADKYATDEAYGCVRWNNDALGQIKNLNASSNSDKKILILTDSFSWYLATYLACDVGEIDLIHPMEFDGSIRKYVEETKPDLVLLMYCERNIVPIDLSTHKSQFDLR